MPEDEPWHGDEEEDKLAVVVRGARGRPRGRGIRARGRGRTEEVLQNVYSKQLSGHKPARARLSETSKHYLRPHNLCAEMREIDIRSDKLDYPILHGGNMFR